MDLNKYLAKKNKTKNEIKVKTIAQHINDLQHCLEVLVNLGYVETEHLRKLNYIACKYHDYGKVNPEFQKRIQSEKKINFQDSKEVAHNILSLFFYKQ